MKHTIIIAALFSVLCMSCSDSDNPVAQRARQIRRNKGSIVIAAASPWGKNENGLWNGISLACDETNSSGGVLGRKIQLLQVDDEQTASGGQKAAYTICENKLVSAVIGHSSSSISIANSLIYQYYGILMVSPLSTNEKLTRQGFSYVFRNIPVDAEIGAAAAEFCRQKGWSRILVYYADTDYGQNLSNSFEMKCSSLALEVVDRKNYSNDSPSADSQAVIRQWMKNFAFDAVFVAGDFPRIGDIIKEIHTYMPDVPVIGGETLNSYLLFQMAGSKAEHVFMPSIFNPDSDAASFTAFNNAYQKKYNHMPDEAALQGYDAFKLIVYGMQTAKSAEPGKIADALRAVTDWNGPAGPYSITPDGDVSGKQIFMIQTRNGSFVRAE